MTKQAHPSDISYATFARMNERYMGYRTQALAKAEEAETVENRAFYMGQAEHYRQKIAIIRNELVKTAGAE